MPNQTAMKLVGPVATERTIAALTRRYEATNNTEHLLKAQTILRDAASNWPLDDEAVADLALHAGYRVLVRGWAADKSGVRTIQRAFIRLADGREAEASISMPRPDVALAFQQPELQRSGYEVDFEIRSETELEGFSALVQWTDGTESVLAFPENVKEVLNKIGIPPTAETQRP